jgi:uncharacterized phage protein (predicted DNA packaging)
MVSLEEAKAYMRVDIDDDDALIQSLIDGAAAYLAGAGILDSEDSRYALAVKALTLHWYDNRGDTVNSTVIHEIPCGLRTVIQQLKMDQPGFL